MKVKEILKSNKFSYSCITQVKKIQYIVQYSIFFTIIFHFKKYVRVNQRYKKTPYEKLKHLKNKHKGERCFIVATGPSLTIADLEKLKNEVTFGMNSICLAFAETDWRPTYYGIQDGSVYRKLEEHINQLAVEGKFVSDVTLKQVKSSVSEDVYIFPLHLLNHNLIHRKYHTKFSDDVFEVVYDGYSITYSLIQIAVYMGFKEIYLLGADCHYSPNMNHHFREYNHIDPSFSSAGEKMISAYKVAKNYAEGNNIKIMNATRGGMLEVFERVDLDALLATNKVIDKVR